MAISGYALILFQPVFCVIIPKLYPIPVIMLMTCLTPPEMGIETTSLVAIYFLKMQYMPNKGIGS